MSLENTQALLNADYLLAGLGKDCASYSIPANFPVVTDLERSYYLIASQEMWAEDASGDDQFFEDINGAAVDRYERYEYDDVLIRQQSISKGIGEMSDYLFSEVSNIIKTRGVVEHLNTAQTSSIEPAQVKSLVEDVYATSITGHFLALVEAAFFGGVESWPIAQHFQACYQTGGIPTGWVGPLPADGGVAQDCMQLLHFGPQDKA